MKKKVILGVVALALFAVSCGKEKTCRCSVIGTSTVRIIKLDGGDCRDLHVYTYHNSLDSLKVDSLVCTDYEFEIDSIYNK
jgi:hypothetical protein